MNDKDFKDLKEVGEYITNLQNNFRLAVQEIEKLKENRENIIIDDNKQIKRLVGEIEKGNDVIRNLQYNKRLN